MLLPPAVVERSVTIAFLVFAGQSALAQTVPGCGELDMGYGPFDYTNSQHVREFLPRVEEHHLEEEIQHLQEDADPAGIGQNLSYVLGAFPNHHRALDLMVRYLQQFDGKQPKGVWYSMECYFERAIFFKPDDGVVHMLFGNYLFAQGEFEEARAEYELALPHIPTNPELHYNLGLLLVKMGEYERAMEHARVAYDAGFPLPGLKKKLESAGYAMEVQ